MFSMRLKSTRGLFATSGLLILLSLVSARAWGPHETITQAALDALGTNDAIVLHLGNQARRLTNYAWMGDYFRRHHGGTG